MTGTRGKGGPHRMRIPAVVLVSLLMLLTAGAGWVYLKLNGNISTFDADGLSDDRPGAGAAGQNVLVIGSDSRSGGNSGLGGGEGDVGRSDTAFLLHVYGDRKHAVGVSIPRDTLVDIPPCRLPDGTWTPPRTRAMFNSAFSVGESAKGNPACTQNTVEKLTGLRVDHTVVVDFEGFSAMTSAVGGVQVCVPKDVYAGDLNPHLGTRGDLLFPRGQQSVSGRKALDYVRVRHGIGDGSDIGRIQRQQAFVSSMIKKVRSQGLNPTTLLPLADAATKSMTVDPGLGSADKLISFAMSLKHIDLHDIKFVTVPWRYAGDRVDIVQPDADALWASLKADRTIDGQDATGKGRGSAGGAGGGAAQAEAAAPVKGEGTRVSVANGTTVTGLAARAAAALEERGFTVTGTTTAHGRDQATTVIAFGPGQAGRAHALARMFPGAYVRGDAADGISVTLGRDYAAAPTPGAEPSPDPSGTPPPDPSGTPSPETKARARSADDDPCADLSYG
ncbi:transcriptional regulator [Streptomyces eurocidicus]|uniref:LCP family protein required for cell wall assembly n=1 Tax=Streptomyces eurocidicus TaxID=66423 RepID=A0A2N8NR50_STREU|nr:LCP family protein [Streptomyces eurocidicus]MBB5117040.1 LCP family protein required for cell wall assembly [Streptomyces eurocidicus]PNE31250.1 transcriptional regulator [Streptomyces eurocidicus]